MKESNLLVHQDKRGVAVVTLNRPEVLNAVDEGLIERLTETFCELGCLESVRIIVLQAEGRAFCAGADVAWMQRAAAQDFDKNLEDARRFAAMMAAIADCEKPVVAKVQGAALGGGVGLACAADIVVASKNARFSVSEAKLGIIPAVIAPYLVNAIGLRQARRLALSCVSVTSAEALALGLVHQVAPLETLSAALELTLEQLLLPAPKAQAHVKRLYKQLHVGAVTGEVQELTASTIARVRCSEEARAGFAAFREKLPAPWHLD